ncbi:hypothetical protein G5V59_00080 [Nocardioides sp. W3-2-3]|uniref:hypothetical protein n=1 Tax=Nocardioides convexus TaxID=2712224 RepID=UPI002418AEBE|nr:hypothetical protein [Nocardioides convexus]NGZ99371.1 hypothetical protein [Nocardioides convexus]
MASRSPSGTPHTTTGVTCSEHTSQVPEEGRLDGVPLLVAAERELAPLGVGERDVVAAQERAHHALASSPARTLCPTSMECADALSAFLPVTRCATASARLEGEHVPVTATEGGRVDGGRDQRVDGEGRERHPG